MKVCLKTTGRGKLAKDSRVRLCGLVYIVISADEPTELDEMTAITECDVQPADHGGKTVTNVELVTKKERKKR